MEATNYKQYKGVWLNLGPERAERLLTRSECRAMLKQGGLLVRNVHDFDCAEETEFWFVIKDHFGGMEEFNSKMRNQLRRSLSHYTYRIITREELCEKGYNILCNATEHYRVKAVAPSRKEFLQRLNNGLENEYWGAFDTESGSLVAYALNQVFENSCNYSVLKADPGAMKDYVYYGLIHSMNEYYLQQRGLDYVCDGARSITEHSNIQGFLIEKYHFRKAYCRLHLHYKPWMALAVKILYPFRRWLPNQRVRAILSQEAMARHSR